MLPDRPRHDAHRAGRLACDAGGWEILQRELDAWAALGRRATLWWRDDDACAASPALARLLDLAATHRVPVAIAAIPARIEPSLGEAIAACGEATIVQHGYAHVNHAPAGERAAELGSHRPLAARLAELARGCERLASTFGERFEPVLVPPWNRIADDSVAKLASAGLGGLSCFAPRARATAEGIAQVNTHVDPIAWRRGRVFAGTLPCIERVVAHLRARRTGEADADEPTGILTHHLAFADDAFAFVDALLRETSRHPAAAWLDARAAFAATGHFRPISMNRV
jgi:hypothetical protein